MNWPSLLARRPWTAAVSLGMGLSLVSAPASLSVAVLADALLPDGWFGASAAGDLTDWGGLEMLLLGVLLVPVVETVLGQCLPIELLRRLREPSPACVLASALLFSGYHLIGGGLGHALTTLACGSLFALAYVLCRPAGWRVAATAACATHASHNFLVFFVLTPLFGG